MISAPSSCGGTVGNCRVCCRTYPLVERKRDHLDNCSMEKTFSTYMQTSVVWRVCRQAHMLCILFASSGVTATSRLLCDKTTFTKEGKDRRIGKSTRWHIIMYNVNDPHILQYIIFMFFCCCLQGCISCGILVSGIRERGVSSEHMENMEMFSCSPTQVHSDSQRT